MGGRQPDFAAWKDPVSSVSPIKVVDRISKNTEVTVITGEKDDVAPTGLSIAFYDTLRKNGIKAELITIPKMGHEILLNDRVFVAIKTLLKK